MWRSPASWSTRTAGGRPSGCGSPSASLVVLPRQPAPGARARRPGPRLPSRGDAAQSRPTTWTVCSPTSTFPRTSSRPPSAADTLARRAPPAAAHPVDVVRAHVAHDLELLPRRPRRVGHRVLQAGLRPVGHRSGRLRPGDRRRRRHRDRRRRRAGRPPPAPRRCSTLACYVTAVASVLAIVFLLPAFLTSSLAVAAVLLFFGSLCLTMPVAPSEALVSDVVPGDLRGRASAIRSVVRALSALSPLLVGLLSGDHRPLDRARHPLAALRHRRARHAPRRPHLPVRPGRRRPARGAARNLRTHRSEDH